VLVDVVLFVGRRQHFRFVDVIDADRFQNLGFDEMPDTHLGHHRDGHGVHDLQDQFQDRSCAPRPMRADIRRHAPRAIRLPHQLFGDAGVLGGDDVHGSPHLETSEPGPFTAKVATACPSFSTPCDHETCVILFTTRRKGCKSGDRGLPNSRSA
jgi:hypothetical protein